jgi:hypothetical protein
MKTYWTILIVVVLLFACAPMIGLVGFHYPRVIENEPLEDPHRVVRFEGSNLFLENGTIIALEPFWTEPMAEQLKMASFEVDLERQNDGSCYVLARRNGWICGTPWAQPIRIPLIADTVYKNRRELIGVGSDVVPKGAATNGSAAGVK